MKSIQIRCQNDRCGALFGVETNGILHKKNRDMYLMIDGKAWGPCRKCGQMIRWSNDDDSSRPG